MRNGIRTSFVAMALPLVAGALALVAIARPLAGQAPVDARSVVDGAGAPTVRLPRVEATLELDAVLDEAAWSEAVRLGGFWQYEPVDGIPAEDATEVLAWYSSEAVHFAIIAHDRRPESIRATRAERAPSFRGIEPANHRALRIFARTPSCDASGS